MQKLTRDFYNRDTVIIAKELLGKYMVHNHMGVSYVARIVETEAYKGLEDKACHSFGGKITNRNKVMFGTPGYAYVYKIYGMYDCMNIVTEPEGNPCAVLIRAVEPAEALQQMAQNRFGKDYESLTKKEIWGISSGPGKLCMAMEITRDCYGDDLCGNKLYIADDGKKRKEKIISAKRININYAEEAIDYPWRFYIENNQFVSKK